MKGFTRLASRRWLALCLGGAACLATALVQAKAPKGRYTVANNEVTDNKTGLIWRQSTQPSKLTFDGAIAACLTLGNGYRAPNIKELNSLIDDSSSPAIDEEAFPDTPADTTWSSTPIAGMTDSGWTVRFSVGDTNKKLKSESWWVRCVR